MEKPNVLKNQKVLVPRLAKRLNQIIDKQPKGYEATAFVVSNKNKRVWKLKSLALGLL